MREAPRTAAEKSFDTPRALEARQVPETPVVELLRDVHLPVPTTVHARAYNQFPEIPNINQDADDARVPRDSYFRMTMWLSALSITSIVGPGLYFIFHAVPAAVYGVSVPGWMVGVLGAGIGFGIFFGGLAFAAYLSYRVFSYMEKDLRRG